MLGLGLKVVFHWFGQIFILLKPLLKLIADKFILTTTEKSERLWARSLVFVKRLSKRSFIQIKNYKRSKVDPCGTPNSILDHENIWPVNITLCFLSFKNSVSVLKRLPYITFRFNLKIWPLCHTLSKALDMSKNAERASWPSSKDL